MFSKTAAVLGGMAAVANAHIKMTSPVPYGDSSLNNSPLEESGSDFPCKQRPGVYDAEGASNTYELGGSGELSFIGTAVHGGGSCQVSITYDEEPDENSVWKVIKSIEGGCPAQDTEGNLEGDDPNNEIPYKYSFDIPSDIPSGKATLAWTWFNKVGNREMYMNCAPVELSGSGGDESAFNALPDMFTANINNGCGTSEGNDVEFPNAGENVERLNGATEAFGPPTGSCESGGGDGGNDGGDDTGSEPPAVTQAPEVPEGGNETPEEGGNEGGEEAPVEGGDDWNTGNPPTEETPEETPEGGEDTTTPPPTGGDGGSQQGACTEEGAYNCIGGSTYQRCASGAWTAPQELAAGTSCESLAGGEMNMIVTRNGRSRPIRFAA